MYTTCLLTPAAVTNAMGPIVLNNPVGLFPRGIPCSVSSDTGTGARVSSFTFRQIQYIQSWSPLVSQSLQRVKQGLYSTYSIDTRVLRSSPTRSSLHSLHNKPRKYGKAAPEGQATKAHEVR